MENKKRSLSSSSLFLTVLFLLAASSSWNAQGRDSTWSATKYEIDVHLDPEREILQEKTKLSLQASSETFLITLALNENLHVLSVKPEHGSIDFRKRGEDLMIYLDPPLKGKNSLTIELEGKIRRRNSEGRKAFLKESILLLWSDLWYPVAEEGWTKFLIRVTLPERFQVIGPGREISRTTRSGMRTSIWQNEKASSSYTIMADTRWNVKSLKRGLLKIQTYLYPEEESVYFDRIISSSTDVLNYYSEIFCSYPFPQFSLVELEGLKDRQALNSFIAYSPESLIKVYSSEGYEAHATALLWWGYAIGGKGKGGWEWMKGLGSYAAYLYCEHAGLPLNPFLRKLRLEYFFLDPKSDVPVSEWNDQSPQALIYGKGPAIMEMLRYMVGKDRFFKALKTLFREKLFSPLSLEEFQQMMEKGTGRRLQTFFNEWVYRSGAPNLRMDHKIRKTYRGEYRVDLKIEQIGQPYTLPVEILIAGPEGRKVEKVNMKDKERSFFFIYDFKPEYVLLDPHHKIFRWEEAMREAFQKLSLKEDIDRNIQEAAALAKIGDFQEAEKIYRNSLRRSPACRELLYHYAQMEQARKNYRKALDLYKEAIRGKSVLEEGDDSLLPWSYIKRGNIFDLLGERKKAIKEYKKALKQPDLLHSKKMAERYIQEPYAEK